MSQIKPVAWRMTKGGSRVFVDDEREVAVMMEHGWRCEPVYTIPDTHRIVSVDLLRQLEKFAEEARDHYSGMNDEVCQSYSEPWQQGVAVCEELCAIIANK